MTNGGWVIPFEYTAEQAEAIIKIIRPYLLEKYQSSEQIILQEISKAVGVAKSTFEQKPPAYLIRHFDALLGAHQKLTTLLHEIQKQQVLLERMDIEHIEDMGYDQYQMLCEHYFGKKDTSYDIQSCIQHVLGQNENLFSLLLKFRDMESVGNKPNEALRGSVASLS